jgi:hypothetical protein
MGYEPIYCCVFAKVINLAYFVMISRIVASYGGYQELVTKP